ncbi:MAG: DEAD/DEAH box helicase [Bryobacterales bacterium]|nr:DEAD/DEAH box helicase [Bryobacterales bacterium]
MNTSQPLVNTLLATFSSLTLNEQIVLELLSVYYNPVHSSDVLELVRCASGRSQSVKPLTLAGWRQLAKKLRSGGLLQGTINSLQCSPDIVEAITRNAEREGRLGSHLRILYERRPEMDPDSSSYGFYYNYESIYRSLRIAVYCNDVQSFAMLRDEWARRSWHYGGAPFAWETRLFGQPLDLDWLQSRDPLIRDTAVYRLVRDAHDGLLPVDQLSGLLNDAASQLESDHPLYSLAIEHALLCGNLEAAEKWLHGNTNSVCELYRGWLFSVRGQREAAITHFEDALATLRKIERKRDLVLSGLFGPLYVFALISTGDRSRLAAATKYVDSALREEVATPLHKALRCAIHLAEGKVEIAKSTVGDIDRLRVSELAPLDALVVYIVFCWCDDAAAQDSYQEIRALETRASRAGYRWVALEFRRIGRRVVPASQNLFPDDEPVDALGTDALLNSLKTVSSWERGLAALERMTAESFAAKPKRVSESRLVWRVSLSDAGPAIEPVEQKLSKTGKWSKGRSVGLKRLHTRTNVEFLSPQDFKVCAAIQSEQYLRYAPVYYLDYNAAFQALVGHPQVYRQDTPTKKVEIVRSDPQLRVTTEGGVVRMRLVPEPPDSGDTVIEFQSETRLVVSVFDRQHREIAEVLGSDGLGVPSDMSHKIGPAIHSVSSLLTVHSDLAAADTGSTEVAADTTPQFRLTPFEDGLQVEPAVRPLGDEGPSLSPGHGGVTVFAYVDGKGARAQRDLADETRRFEAVASACPSLSASGWNGTAWILPDPQSSLELLEELRLLGDAVKVSWPEGEKLKVHDSANTDRLALRIRRHRDWFGIEGKVELDSGLVLTLRQVLDLMESATGRFLPLKNNEFLALTDRFRQRVEDLTALVDRQGKQLRLHASRAHALESIVEDAGSVDSDAAWAKQIQRFRDAQSLDPDVPSTLQADLREYQVEGFKWATRLAEWGAGACLADDMGLGKTIQALAVALSRAPSGPTLVVAPTSVCPNWIDEAHRFSPTLNCRLFGPGNRQRMLEHAGPFDVVVCSYGLLHQEADDLAGVQWSTIVLDEAQAIKNRETMRSRAAMRLAGDFRMITTGTPIENHLGELHNLFNFINPGLLGTADSFAKNFASPIHQSGSQSAKARLRRLIQPFILRRTKSAVLDELPARTEITLRIEMSREERALYEAMRQRAVEKLESDSDAEAKTPRHLKVLAEITRLRRACCHPRLVMPEAKIEGSKLETFLETIEELMENRHKALVFSQFVSHLEIVRGELDRRKIDYRYLDGSTPSRKRKQEVDAFQAGSGSLFLISLRAGGQGLNLTAADYVVHLDPWWNPAVEDQASDRAHRIGQTRPVTIYRLVMKDSIEEKIVDLHRSKRDLADNLLAGTDLSGKMSADELLGLLRDN